MTEEQLKKYLDLLLEENEKAIKEGEIPVSALLLFPDDTYLIEHNQVEKTNNPLLHAEIQVISKALTKANTKYLKDCTLLVSLEPCLTCMGAILKTGIPSLYYVLDDEKEGALSYHHVFADNRIQIHRIKDARFADQMKSFFLKMRKNASSL